MKNIVILGSTGSIGTQALDIVSRLPEKLRVVGLAANNNSELLANQANTYRVPNVCIGDSERVSDLRSRLEYPANVHVGVDGMSAI